MFAYRQDALEKQSAWEILHDLQCDLEYMLSEMGTNYANPLPRHALFMIFKRTISELEKAKVKVEKLTEEK